MKTLYFIQNFKKTNGSNRYKIKLAYVKINWLTVDYLSLAPICRWLPSNI